MRINILPQPPNPDDAMYKNNPLAYNRAVYDWMNTTKGKIEQCSQINDTPMNQPFVVQTGYTSNNTITSTSTGTDVANFLCTLISAMIKKGMITSNSN